MKQQEPKIPFYFIVVVWGDDYVDMLLQIALRCYLSPKNIPNLMHLDVSKFIFVTTLNDFLRISQAPIYKTLEQYLEPVFIELDAPLEDNVYCRMTRGYELATKLASEKNAYAVYLLPDGIVSDGTFTQLERYAKAGRDVILLPGPRVIKEKFISHVREMNIDDNEPLCFESRKLVTLGLSCFHNEFKHYNFSGKQFTKWPHMVTWDIPGQDGLLLRAFHLHPLMVNCSSHKRLVSFNKFDTIDASFIQKNFFDLNKFLWETDSDNMILYSMTHENDRIEEGLLWNSTEKKKAIVDISQSSLVNELQKIHFYNVYKLHPNELTAEWDEVQQHSFEMVKSVIDAKTQHNRYVVHRVIAKRLLKLLPLVSQEPLKRFYWKTKGAVSWCKAKLYS